MSQVVWYIDVVHAIWFEACVTLAAVCSLVNVLFWIHHFRRPCSTCELRKAIIGKRGEVGEGA